MSEQNKTGDEPAAQPSAAAPAGAPLVSSSGGGVPPAAAAPAADPRDSEIARLVAVVERLKALNEAAAAQAAFQIPTFNQNEVYLGVSDKTGKETWRYLIDLPPSGGPDIKICGVPYYHGQSYEVNIDTLRTLKDIVHRAWAHEASIKGSNENFYRQPTERILRGQDGPQRR